MSLLLASTPEIFHLFLKKMHTAPDSGSEIDLAHIVVS
jgi:hypothetical protein